MAKKGWIPKDAECGTCKYLPESEPCICQKTGEVRKKGNQKCEEYAQKRPSINNNDEDDVLDISDSTESITDAIDEKDLIAPPHIFRNQVFG